MLSVSCQGHDEYSHIPVIDSPPLFIANSQDPICTDQHCCISSWLQTIGSIFLLFMVLLLTFVLSVCFWSPQVGVFPLQRTLFLTHSSPVTKYLQAICLSLRILKPNLLSQPAWQVTSLPKTGRNIFGQILCYIIVILSSVYNPSLDSCIH